MGPGGASFLPHIATSFRSRNGDLLAGTGAVRGGEVALRRSVEAARAVDAQYELALTLRVIAETSGNSSPEADRMLARLGVTSMPEVPLP